ncbi:MAG: squalene/phytoene synthase family protein [Sinobacteraceae bacterium]|nr:squalene/phytoene synthase family protein [Nevskiaceae bacterium]
MLPTADAQRHRLLARLYSPSASRALLEPLLAIEAETGASLRPGTDHQVAHTRLQWWAEECARCVRGEALHPLTRQLAAASNEPRQLAGLSGLVATNIWDLAQATFETRAELLGYCERWAAAMIEPLIPSAALERLRPLGATLCELELLVAFAPEALAGRLRLPLEDLERCGAQASEAMQQPYSPALAQLLAQRHQALRARMTSTLAALEVSLQMELRGLLVWVALTLHASSKAAAALPALPRSGGLTVLADSWLAWRGARQASSGRFAIERAART